MTFKKTFFVACCSILAISGPVSAQDAGWQFNVQGLALQRSGTDAVPLIVDGGIPTVYLSGDEFDADLSGGLKFSASRDITDRTDLVIDGFFAGRMSATRTVSAAGAQFTVYGADFGTSPVSLNYDSSLMGTGATWRYASQNGNVRWLGGLRAMRLGESMKVTDAASPPNLFSGELSNNMLGIQAGVEATAFKNDRWEIAGGAKLGAYSNSANFDAAFPQAGPAAVFTANGYNVATSAELWIGADYQFSKSTSLNFGYQAMLLNNVGLLPEQLDDLAVPILGQMDMGGVPLYQGITFGVQTNW